MTPDIDHTGDVHWPITPAHGGDEELLLARDPHRPNYVRFDLPPSVCRNGFLTLPLHDLRQMLDVLERPPSPPWLP